MVVDNIKNAGMYACLGEGIKKALKFLQSNDLPDMKSGRYEIDGSNVYASVAQYETRLLKECAWEAHRKYIDVQYVAEGAEQMGYAYTGNLEVTKEYDPKEDYLLLAGNGSMIICNAGTFIIFGPEDAHMPSVAIDKPKPVKKVIVKVRV